MNYLYHYKKLVRRAISDNRVKLKKSHKNYIYYESHHIIPKSLGGTNVSSNIVLLTAREHFVAHILLVKICEKRYGRFHKNTYKMIVSSNRQKLNSKNSYVYERNKLKLSECMRVNNPMNNPEYRKRMADAKRGKMFKIKNKNPKGPWNKGKITGPISQEIKDKMSNSRKGIKKKQEHKNSISLANKGIPKSKEHKLNISKFYLGTKWMNNGSISKQIQPTDLEKMISVGWKYGRLK